MCVTLTFLASCTIYKNVTFIEKITNSVCYTKENNTIDHPLLQLPNITKNQIKMVSNWVSITVSRSLRLFIQKLQKVQLTYTRLVAIRMFT